MPFVTTTRTEDGEVYLAGQRVPAGRYRQIEGCREVCLSEEDVLPASLDGRIACYERILPNSEAYPYGEHLFCAAVRRRETSGDETRALIRS